MLNADSGAARAACAPSCVSSARAPVGRETLLKFKYGNSSKAGVYSLQPFFQYRVCFLYPLPGVSTHSKIESFDEALGVVWCPNGENSNDGCMEVYNRTTFAGRATIGGTPCQLVSGRVLRSTARPVSVAALTLMLRAGLRVQWDYKNNSPPVTVQEVKFCVGDDGSLVSVNLTFSGLQKLNNDTCARARTNGIRVCNLIAHLNLSTACTQVPQLCVLSECLQQCDHGTIGQPSPRLTARPRYRQCARGHRCCSIDVV